MATAGPGSGAFVFALLFYSIIAFVLGDASWPVELWHMPDGGGIRFITLLVFIFWITLGAAAFSEPR